MSAAPALPFRLPPPVNGAVDVLIIAGEHSGDQLATAMLREVQQMRPDWQVAAIGGPELAKQGAQLLHDLTANSVIGFVEVLKNYSYFKALFDATAEWIGRYRPRAVCFVDYPGFNLRLAKELNRRGLAAKAGGPVKLLYYVSPQIWAWKAKRRFPMAQHLDALAVLFPFEVAAYADTALPVQFVGHPFLLPAYEAPVSYAADAPVLLLPGSRTQAVSRIYPALLAGWQQSGAKEAVVIYPSDTVKSVIEGIGVPAGVRLERTGGVVTASAVLMSSGTMSLHCALAGIPGAIAYKLHPLTYWMAMLLVKTPWIGIANIILDEAMYPEFIQAAATPQALSAELRAALADPARAELTRDRERRLREALRPPEEGPAGWLVKWVG